MTLDPPTIDLKANPAPDPRAVKRRRVIGAAALLGAFVVGGGVAALVTAHPQATIVALTPKPIATLTPWSTVAVKGEVADIFGGAFVVQDDSGRALVETGPGQDGTAPVGKAETVTVQGRFDRGVIHAIAISHADGRTDIVGPPGPPPPGHGPMAWMERHGIPLPWHRADLPNQGGDTDG